ncbi:MAG TPA: HDOD domain-containing protein [Fibrobacteria bacterium]|nr:HDOD domain-containing protein [Fibrobacteria bacterium]
MSLSVWLKRISDKEMPAFRRTAMDVMDAAGDAELGSDALGRVILKDPALTARVLRIANTVGHNPTGQRILTVSKAILLLGADAIRNICLGVALMESLLQARRHDRVMADLGRSIHAAQVARALALAKREPKAEEVFIAGLLYKVGHMVFWCVSEDEGVALDGLVRPGSEDSSAEKAVLGFSLSQLSQALVEEWRLSSLLPEIYRGSKESIAAECVLAAWRWCRALESGWEGPMVRQELDRLAAWLGWDPVSAMALLGRLSGEARETAQLFGSQACADTIPVPPSADDGELFAQIVASGREDRPVVDATGPDENPDRQLECLRALSALALEGGLPEIFSALVEGLHDGVGLDRVVFCGMEAGDRVVGQVGAGDPEFANRFQFTLRRQMADSLSRALEHGGFVENVLSDPSRRPAILPESLGNLRGTPFLFGVLQLGGRTLGAVYADRGTSGRDLTDSVVEGFRHLVQQANLLMARSATIRSGVASTPPT